MLKGYWRIPEKTKAEVHDDRFFITGDLGKIDGEGYVNILGRGMDLVISGGFNVYPKEIESEIDAMPGVIESAVIGVPHAHLGEGVTAELVCNKSTEISEASPLKALEGRLMPSLLNIKLTRALRIELKHGGASAWGRLTDPPRPLRGFSSKIVLGYALGRDEEEIANDVYIIGIFIQTSFPIKRPTPKEGGRARRPM
ncbi:hypothetical protein ACVIN2_002939 [Bradyrhizobium sp. USDA 3650]